MQMNRKNRKLLKVCSIFGEASSCHFSCQNSAFQRLEGSVHSGLTGHMLESLSDRWLLKNHEVFKILWIWSVIAIYVIIHTPIHCIKFTIWYASSGD